MKVEVPADLEQAPAGTATAPPAASGLVTFGSATATSRAAASSGTDAQQANLVPVEDLPVSIGRADDQPAPTGTWQVSVADRAAPVAQGVDGALITIQAPATGSVPVSVELDYAKFKNLYGADWASRLRFVQFPECYLVTPEDEACQTYEELETVNDTTTESITATVDTAADGTVTPAVAEILEPTGPSVAQATDQSSVTRVAAGGDTAVVGAVDSGGGAGGTFKATPPFRRILAGRRFFGGVHLVVSIDHSRCTGRSGSADHLQLQLPVGGRPRRGFLASVLLDR